MYNNSTISMCVNHLIHLFCNLISSIFHNHSVYKARVTREGPSHQESGNTFNGQHLILIILILIKIIIQKIKKIYFSRNMKYL